MEYVGIQSQIRSNHIKSIFLLILFPITLFALFWAIIYFTNVVESRNAASEKLFSQQLQTLTNQRNQQIDEELQKLLDAKNPQNSQNTSSRAVRRNANPYPVSDSEGTDPFITDLVTSDPSIEEPSTANPLNRVENVNIFQTSLQEKRDPVSETNETFLIFAPFITLGVIIWFTIAYFSHTSIIEKATGSRPLTRMENKRMYNLVENLCITAGMTPPKINIIEDDSLNAFASGISKKSYTISLSRGIINTLNDEELSAVIAHELSHIRNRDVDVLMISIIFVGIFAFLYNFFLRAALRGNNKKGRAQMFVIGLILAPIAYLISLLFRFAISRQREYMADAGAAELTKNPHALASALRRISQNPYIEAVQRKDIAQLFIENPKGERKSGFFTAVFGLFKTHPPIQDRITILEQF